MTKRHDASEPEEARTTSSEGEIEAPAGRPSHSAPVRRDATPVRPDATATRRRARAVTSEEPMSGERLEIPTPDRMLFAVLNLTRAVNLEMHDEEIVHAYVDTLRELFPARQFAVQLVAPDSGELVLVYATGRLLTGRRERLLLSREALARHGIAHTPTASFNEVAAYAPLFHESASGFDVPLQDGERVIGVLSTEYPHGVRVPADDRPVIVPLALQLSASLRNARLLRESIYLRDYLGKLLDQAAAPVVVFDKNRQIRFANRAFTTLTGYVHDELIGRDFLGLLRDEDRRRLLPIFVNAVHGEPAINLEVKIPRRTGGLARIAMNTATVRSTENEVEGVITIGRDVTEIRELEEQVIQAEKLATLGQLAAGVVHELNNPLTSISVYADYLLRRGERNGASPDDLDKLRRIVESAERILNFTRDLVAYARPASEEPRSLAIVEVLEQALGFCEHIITESGTQIERSFGDGLPAVYAVRGQLHQVFINLITNACHAMTPPHIAHSGRLLIEAKHDGDSKLLVRIADNGSGIPEENRERVFEPFFSTKGEGKGTGLGLSIVRNIVQQHGGSIKIESHIGKGTTFEILLHCRPERR